MRRKTGKCMVLGLSETSVGYWQDQPGSFITRAVRGLRVGAQWSWRIGFRVRGWRVGVRSWSRRLELEVRVRG